MTNQVSSSLYPSLERFIHSLETEELSMERKEVLQPLLTFLQSKPEEAVQLNFVCTHNSRRSHLAQVWAQVMSHYYGFDRCTCYSAGTEATAVFPQVIAVLRAVGLQVDMLSTGTNPIYAIRYAASSHPIIGFSKELQHPFNPSSDFVAVMTCSHADEHCPIILGATQRIPITYEDPKVFDRTARQEEGYHQRSRQIAVEMKYIFSQLNRSK